MRIINKDSLKEVLERIREFYSPLRPFSYIRKGFDEEEVKIWYRGYGRYWIQVNNQKRIKETDEEEVKILLWQDRYYINSQYGGR